MAMRVSQVRSEARSSKPPSPAPGAHHGLLDSVVGVRGRAHRAVAVARERGAVLLEVVGGDHRSTMWQGCRAMGSPLSFWEGGECPGGID